MPYFSYAKVLFKRQNATKKVAARAYFYGASSLFLLKCSLMQCAVKVWHGWRSELQTSHLPSPGAAQAFLPRSSSMRSLK
jgi:hypothetical protein